MNVNKECKKVKMVLSGVWDCKWFSFSFVTSFGLLNLFSNILLLISEEIAWRDIIYKGPRAKSISVKE